MAFLGAATLWLACLFASLVQGTDLDSYWKTNCNVADKMEPRVLVRFEKEIYQTMLKLNFKVDVFDDVDLTEEGVFVFLSCVQIDSLGTFRNFSTIIEIAQPLAQKLNHQSGVIPDGYKDLLEIENFLAGVVQRYPDIAALVDMSQYGAGKIVEGRSLPVLKISDNVHESEDEHRVLINGAHHAREIVTPQISMDIITWLTAGYNNHTNGIRSIVDSYEIFIAPVWNPDGYAYVWTDNNMWRKNRKLNYDGTYGVDQNRNYDLGWNGDCPGSTVPSSQTYKGPSPASEEETSTMKDFTLKNNIAKVLDFHSSGREVLLGYRCEPLSSLISNWINAEGTALSRFANYATRPPSGDGQHQEWTIAETASYAFLVETATSFQPSFEDAEEEAKRVWPLVEAFLERPISLHGHATAEGSPVRADITISGVTDIRRFANPDQNGLYHLFLPVGVHTITFNADPFLPVTFQVNIASSTTSIFRDVQMFLPSN